MNGVHLRGLAPGRVRGHAPALARRAGHRLAGARQCALRCRSCRRRSRSSRSTPTTCASSSSRSARTAPIRRRVARPPRRSRRSSPGRRRRIEEALRALADRLGQKPRQAFEPIRIAITGSKVSPGLFESLELLGKDESLARLARRGLAPEGENGRADGDQSRHPHRPEAGVAPATNIAAPAMTSPLAASGAFRFRPADGLRARHELRRSGEPQAARAGPGRAPRATRRRAARPRHAPQLVDRLDDPRRRVARPAKRSRELACTGSAPCGRREAEGMLARAVQPVLQTTEQIDLLLVVEPVRLGRERLEPRERVREAAPESADLCGISLPGAGLRSHGAS